MKPHAVYVVLGATHPNLVREQGEAYRESLIARARNLGIADHVVFINEFVDQPKLLQFIAMCDVYVTPYLNEDQMTSGTLAYSFGMGKAVVSTPYWHAKELLAGGRGILVPFGDTNAIGREIASLLGNDVRRHAMCKRAYAASRSMIWPETAKAYLATFDNAIDAHVPDPSVVALSSKSTDIEMTPPPIRTDHLQAMCDSTGILQHAVHCVPDRHHGYCVDDNARALLLGIALDEAGEQPLPDALMTRFAAFIQHAWNPDLKRFRNFMSYDRRWLEARGSEDSQGRTLWALGRCAAYDRSVHRRAWAKSLFQSALPASVDFSSPRAWAFVLLGLDAYCSISKQDADAAQCRRELTARLMRLLAVNGRDDWYWFEDVLAYDNARLPEALIVTGAATGTAAHTAAGLKALHWLMARQTADAGHFRPVGSDSFGNRHALPSHFDQQPIEAAATISACRAASAVDASADWDACAIRAFRWFTGINDLRMPLTDPETGGCFDGLHPDRPNRNMGAESVLAYLVSAVEIRQLLRSRAKSGGVQIVRTLAISA